MHVCIYRICILIFIYLGQPRVGTVLVPKSKPCGIIYTPVRMINVSKRFESFELVAGRVPRSKLFTVDCAVCSQIYEHTLIQKRDELLLDTAVSHVPHL